MEGGKEKRRSSGDTEDLEEEESKDNEGNLFYDANAMQINEQE